MRAVMSLPTLLAIFDHFVIANTLVSSPVVFGALIGGLSNKNNVSINACYEFHYHSGSDLEENYTYDSDLATTLCREGTWVGW